MGRSPSKYPPPPAVFVHTAPTGVEVLTPRGDWFYLVPKQGTRDLESSPTLFCVNKIIHTQRISRHEPTNRLLFDGVAFVPNAQPV